MKLALKPTIELLLSENYLKRVYQLVSKATMVYIIKVLKYKTAFRIAIFIGIQKWTDHKFCV